MKRPMHTPPAYLDTYETGELDERIEQLMKSLTACNLCPRACRVNRTEGETGYCKAGYGLMVSGVHPHYGEEDVLVGTHGSGTIFLTHCNLGCLFCQNYEISHLGIGQPVTEEEFAASMLRLQEFGCHNINFVSPTHYTPQIMSALRIAIEQGLRIPLVYNCGGYESSRTIELLDGIVDIYMPDIKYSDPEVAKRYSNAPDYFEVCKAAVKEMHRQVGDLAVDERGIAVRGLLIRHLVLPHGLAGSHEVLKFIATELSTESYVNIMLQYRPIFRASEYEELNRGITLREYQDAVKCAKQWGLHRGVE
jgi:putative pyruvate formate lyase activating enzyme